MKRRRQVVVAPRAVAQLDLIVDWWRANRAEAPELVAEEFGAALTLLATNPGAGVPYLLGKIEKATSDGGRD